MDIQIQNGDQGISWAIKRQLQSENIDVSKINSCWTEIMNAFNGDSESKINGRLISEQWKTLNSKVRCMVNDVLTIATETWNKIVQIVKKSVGIDDASETLSTNLQTETGIEESLITETDPQTGEKISYDSQNREVHVESYDEEYGCNRIWEYTYTGNSTLPATETRKNVYSNNYVESEEYTYTYDPQNRAIEIQTVNSNMNSKKVSRYNFEGDSTTPSTETQTIVADYEDGSHHENYYEYTYQYGNPPRKLKEDITVTGGLLDDNYHSQTTYEYNEQGILLAEICGNVEKTYDTHGNMIKEITRSSDGNSIKRIVEWTYNDKNQKIYEKQIDGQGNTISEREIDPDEES